MVTKTQIKRLKIRSWRRGIRELDLLLGKFADTQLENLTEAQLNKYEDFLKEDDYLIYSWLSNPEKVKPTFKGIVTSIIHLTKLDV